jgi:hypothetical protein
MKVKMSKFTVCLIVCWEDRTWTQERVLIELDHDDPMDDTVFAAGQAAFMGKDANNNTPVAYAFDGFWQEGEDE